MEKDTRTTVSVTRPARSRWAVMPQPIDTADAEVTAAIQALENLWAQVDNASV